MGDLSGALTNIHSHLQSFNVLEPSHETAQLLRNDNALLQTVDQKVMDTQTLALAAKIINQLNYLQTAQKTLTTKPSASAQSQVAAHLDRETKVMKERIRDLLKRFPSPKRAVEKNYKPKT